jgi:formate dehydrogenase assembly factor FdhD
MNSSRETCVLRYENGSRTQRPDQVAAEEPLEIRIEGRSVAVVMRTPGHDRELTAGFLLTENLIRSPNDIFDIRSAVVRPPIKRSMSPCAIRPHSIRRS